MTDHQLRRLVLDACDGPFGSAIKSEHYVDNGPRVIRLGNIGAGDWRDSDKAFLAENYWRQLSAHHAYPGDVVMAGLGDERNPVGRSCVVPDYVGDALVKADCYRFRVDRNRVDVRYLSAFLSSRAGLEQSVSLSDGSTRQRLTLSKALSLRVPYLPLDVQRRIADFIDGETARIDALVAKKIALVELLTTKFQASVEEFALRKVGGKRVPLKRVVSVERGRFNYRPRNEPSLYGGVFPFVQTGDIRSATRYIDRVGSYLSADGVAVSRSFPAGTTLMGIAANVGDVAISTFEVWCPDSVVGFTPGEMMEADYLYYILKGLRSIINETSTENAQENTNIERLGLLTVPLLSLSDQRRVVSDLRILEARVDGLTARINRQIDLLKEHRQALITAAVTGAIEVPEVSR